MRALAAATGRVAEEFAAFGGEVGLGGGSGGDQREGDFQALGREEGFEAAGEGGELPGEIRADGAPVVQGLGRGRGAGGEGEHGGEVGEGKSRHAGAPAEQPAVAVKEQALGDAGADEAGEIGAGGFEGRVVEPGGFGVGFPGRNVVAQAIGAGEGGQQMGEPGIGGRRVRGFEVGVGEHVAPLAEAAGDDAGAAFEERRSKVQAEAFAAGVEDRCGEAAQGNVGQQQVRGGPVVGGEDGHGGVRGRFFGWNEAGGATHPGGGGGGGPPPAAGSSMMSTPGL